MRIILCTVFVLASLLVSNVNCQEGDGGDSTWWQRFKDAVQKFVEQLKQFWNELKSEIRARTSDMQDWSSEMWTSFKSKMYEWVDQRNDIDDTEKSKMKDYIERLQMPEESD